MKIAGPAFNIVPILFVYCGLPEGIGGAVIQAYIENQVKNMQANEVWNRLIRRP